MRDGRDIKEFQLKYSLFLGKFLVMIGLLCGSGRAICQTTLPTTRQRDTTQDKTNTGKWKDENAKVTYDQLNSAKIHTPDTSLHTYQRQPFLQPWARDLGNLGGPVNNLFFTPDERMGPSLGYHIFDVYRFNADSAKFYTTSRPYSVFSYQMGSKQEQMAGIMHTQNIRPNWNVGANYRKITSPGNYKTQRNNHDNFALTSNFKSLDKHYSLYGTMVYNKQQHDENGGITNVDDLTDPIFGDRKTIVTPYQSPTYSTTRSTVTNVQREFTVLLQHSYAWGVTDTMFEDDEDTTKYSYTLTPRFSITHKTEISSEKHSYKDLSPDSLRYTTLFNRSFANKGTGYYALGGDSVFTGQEWFWADSRVLLSGFIGKEGRQLRFSVGPGIRYDQFISKPVSNIDPDSLPKVVYKTGYERKSEVNSYLAGELKKEALVEGQWEYGAAAQLYYTGEYAGNFSFNASLGKQLNDRKGSFVAGFRQQLNSAPYSYTDYQNVYVKKFFDFSKESVSSVYASLDISRIRLSGGVRSYVINNYIYMNEQGLPAQYTVPFTIPQAWIRKVFKLGNFYLDNEIVYQKVTDNIPVNVPSIMGRHQFSYEQALFKNAIKIATGVEVRYNDTYNPAGYNAQFNRFFFQKDVVVSNPPELSVFFNFRISRFRAFIMGDQLQQIFTIQNTLLYTGTPIVSATGIQTPMYAAPNAMLRFGFSWAMVN